MRQFPLRSDGASLAVTELGAQLSNVAFTLSDGRRVAPMHTAPWVDEVLPEETPSMLRILRGDFLCAPFGASDVIPSDTRPHGATANGVWRARRNVDNVLEAVLDEPLMGASVSLRVEVRAGQAMIYQRHVFDGGTGQLPLGHHAMLRAEQPLKLGFAPWTWAGTPPDPIEMPPAGRSILAYPQQIADLHAAALEGGGTADLTIYPFAEGHEDLWMLVSDASARLSWTAATCADAGWVWFAFKDPRVLPSTVLWLSNGGRTYPPFSSRHRRVIGLEEVCGYFHLGHAASTARNPVAERGTPTAITLGGRITINYAFGLAPAPKEFGAVTGIAPATGGVVLHDQAGRETFAACDLDFVTATSN